MQSERIVLRAGDNPAPPAIWRGATVLKAPGRETKTRPAAALASAGAPPGEAFGPAGEARRGAGGDTGEEEDVLRDS